MIGTRLPDGFEPTDEWFTKLGVTELPAGGYGKDSSGVWCVVTPNGRYGCLAKHTVIEHPNGAITVDPSILVYPIEPRHYTPEERARLVSLTDEAYAQSWERGRPGWHGWLRAGEWSEA